MLFEDNLKIRLVSVERIKSTHFLTVSTQIGVLFWDVLNVTV